MSFDITNFLPDSQTDLARFKKWVVEKKREAISLRVQGRHEEAFHAELLVNQSEDMLTQWRDPTA